ncbi:MAG: hypothetical protein GQ553_02065, partial [Nitrosomonadaceae bacterium]|nr:hypothetical protein [Nitrosomonadaceae bacterium]
MAGPDSTDKLSHEDRRILERKVDLGIDRAVEVTSQPVPGDVTPDEVVSPADRTTNLITGYSDYVGYINQLLAKIKVRALGLRYDVVAETEPGLYAALNALWEGGKTHVSYSDYVDALEFEASVSQEIILKGQGGETSYLEQLRGSAAAVSAGFEAKLLADNNPKEEAGEALLTRPLIVARTMAESQSVNLQKFGSSEPEDDNDDDATVEIFGKEVINTFTKIAAGDDPAQTILDDCIPCLDRSLDMDLQAPLDTLLDDL